MFGVVGFTLYHNAALGLLLAFDRRRRRRRVFGLGHSQIFRAVMRLQSSGTVSMYAAVGSEGSVYLTVSRKEVGCRSTSPIACASSKRCRLMDLRCPRELPIRVQGVTANTLVVAPAERYRSIS